MHINIVRLKAVAKILSTLEDEFVFVGGATVSLYATNPELASEVRPTDDVDVVVEIASYADYVKLDKKLRSVGFVNDTASGVYCRYRIHGIIVDVMPTDDEAIGFTNKWYPEGFKNSIEVSLYDVISIKIFSLPFFIASKWEAYKGRGKDDFRTSKDFEDLVYIFENVDDLNIQIDQAPDYLQEYFKNEFRGLFTTGKFEEGLYSHLQGGYRDNYVGEIIENLSRTFKV
jgi:predicted nucleotidyltransferase